MAKINFPPSPTNNQQYSLNGIYYTYNSTIGAWITNLINSPALLISNTAPSNPGSGTLWWNNVYGRLLVYYIDDDGTEQWVDTNPAADFRPIWGTSNLAFVTANSAFSNANGTHTFAISAYNTANSAFSNANGTHTFAISAYNTANLSFNIANLAFNTANVSNAWANTVAVTANNYAGVMANSANNFANTKLANTNVTLSGNLVSTQSIADSKGDLRNIPVNSQSLAYVLTLNDSGKIISITTGNVFVTSGVFFPGNTVSVFNNSTGNVTITQNTSVTLYSAGTANTGNRILQQRGLATIVCIDTNTFVVTGAGMIS